ncbi:A disintegrin and metalloproteinase with thrombospondin motifs 20-like isoform X2 [Sciurus carolinensis]|uniref:A disintegrin and metalloproteinase with thrombospondin motifs 20-like isoform X2 n=1 Tax=Sciurus carolinensis TaxID=30640 RepID=UPI001FB44777|nr:A disintegrin and metalloproteinase with thrombospondin motifs 20-like isoform X2 [Sciurus carolinensis]
MTITSVNIFALSDAQGNFLLNGGFVVSMLKEEINIQGALFEYSVSNNSIERINSTDRLEEELVLQCLVTYGKGSKQQQVCCQLNEDHLSDGFCNPSTKPESLRPCELHARAAWKVGSWRSCTATCGLGYQICAVKCVNKLVSAVLDDRECQGAIAQVIAVPMGKAAQWRHGSWTPVSEFIEEMQYLLGGLLDISRMFGTDLLKLMYVFILKYFDGMDQV